MKSTLCWFSGAGNSKTAAADLAKRLPFDTVMPISEAMEHPESLDDTKILGLVFPIYFFGPPNHIRRFIVETLAQSELDLEYLFVIFTHGGMPFYGASITDRLLAEAGYAASYVTGIPMVDTYVPLFKIPRKRAQERKHQTAAKRLESVVGELETQSLRIATRLPLSRLFHTLWEQGLNKRKERDRRFRVTDQCTGCGICAKVCPVGNITLEDGRPIFHHRCEQCFACYHHCPEHAIELQPKPLLGYSWYTPPKTFFDKD